MDTETHKTESNEVIKHNGVGTFCTKKVDEVNSPLHYKVGIETIDFIQSKLTEEEFKGYCLGNILKYVSRAKFKGKFKEDLQKAKWYIERVINV